MQIVNSNRNTPLWIRDMKKIALKDRDRVSPWTFPRETHGSWETSTYIKASLRAAHRLIFNKQHKCIRRVPTVPVRVQVSTKAAGCQAFTYQKIFTKGEEKTSWQLAVGGLKPFGPLWFLMRTGPTCSTNIKESITNKKKHPKQVIPCEQHQAAIFFRPKPQTPLFHF